MASSPGDRRGGYGSYQVHRRHRRHRDGLDDLWWIVEYLRTRVRKWLYEMPAWVMTSRDLEPFPTPISGLRVGQRAPGLRRDGDRGGWKGLVGGRRWRPRGQFADEGLLDEMFVCIAPGCPSARDDRCLRRYDFELPRDRAQQGVRLCALIASSARSPRAKKRCVEVLLGIYSVDCYQEKVTIDRISASRTRPDHGHVVAHHLLIAGHSTRFSCTACATSIRSTGSRWCGGRSAPSGNVIVRNRQG